MHDDKYCYPGSNVLKNLLNITSSKDLFNAEVELTTIRLQELQRNPIKGNYDFEHLKKIHKYIFQDIYSWAGQERTVEIGKGNLFCTVACIQSYADSVFSKYFAQCNSSKDDFEKFIKVFSENYGDLNALHPFREGNGRSQREFARIVCLECGYDFRLSNSTHREMLNASQLSFNKGDNSEFIRIFSKAITPHNSEIKKNIDTLDILTSDDLTVGTRDDYDYYGYNEHKDSKAYDEYYKTKILKMNANSQSVKPKMNFYDKLSYYKVQSENNNKNHKKPEITNKRKGIED